MDKYSFLHMYRNEVHVRTLDVQFLGNTVSAHTTLEFIICKAEVPGMGGFIISRHITDDTYSYEVKTTGGKVVNNRGLANLQDSITAAFFDIIHGYEA